MTANIFNFGKRENGLKCSQRGLFSIDKNYSYLAYCFTIPVVLYFLIYLSMEHCHSVEIN